MLAKAPRAFINQDKPRGAGRQFTNTINHHQTMKLAIIIIADPKAGEEAFARAFNALATAQEAQKANDQVEINFIGTGTRWPAEMTKPGHPLNALYNSVRESVQAGSCGCAAAFGATEGLKACGIPEAKDNAVAGTPGLLSVRRYLADGWHTLLF